MGDRLAERDRAIQQKERAVQENEETIHRLQVCSSHTCTHCRVLTRINTPIKCPPIFPVVSCIMSNSPCTHPPLILACELQASMCAYSGQSGTLEMSGVFSV